jgi:hypothetical protein
MAVTSDIPDALVGKEIFVRKAEIVIDIKFGLYKDFDSWLDPEHYVEYWHDLSQLPNPDVCLEIDLGSETVVRHNFKTFESLKITHVFEDMDHNACDLTVKIQNLTSLPVRDDAGKFVAPMIEIESVKLQDIEILSLIPDTMFSKDTSITIPITKPIYLWLMDHWTSLTPDIFNSLPIIDIENYNRKNLFFR